MIATRPEEDENYKKCDWVRVKWAYRDKLIVYAPQLGKSGA